jgi:hypothetical protein
LVADLALLGGYVARIAKFGYGRAVIGTTTLGS